MSLQEVAEFFKQVGPGIPLLGAILTGFAFFLSWRDRNLQRLRTYVDLEFEASRIFRVCVDKPEIITYLEGRSDKTTLDVEERAYWYVCQVLNTFEIMISFRARKLVSTDVFTTWVSWFYEVGISKRFEDYWEKRLLRSHYKPDLRDIMDVAQKLLRNRALEYDEVRELQSFHDEVARLLKDRSISRHFRTSVQGHKAPRPAMQPSAST